MIVLYCYIKYNILVNNMQGTSGGGNNINYVAPPGNSSQMSQSGYPYTQYTQAINMFQNSGKENHQIFFGLQ